MNMQDDPFTPSQAPAPETRIDLTGMDEEYRRTEAAKREDIPDGNYQVAIHSVRLNTSRAGIPMLQYDLVVISGPQVGRHIFKNSAITAKSMPYFKAELSLLGIALEKLSDLEGRLDNFLDLKVEVAKRTKDDRGQIYFKKKLEIPGTAAEAGHDHIPF